MRTLFEGRGGTVAEFRYLAQLSIKMISDIYFQYQLSNVVDAENAALSSFDSIDLNYAVSLSKQALEYMSRHGVPPSPDNFAIWFRYAARSSAELNKTIDVLIGNRKTFDEQTNRDLVRIYLLGDQHADLSNKIRDLVNSARTLVTGAIDDQNAHISALKGFSAQASQGDPKVLISKLVDELLKATSRATSLKSNFVKTSQELDQVRETLARSDKSARTDSLTGLSNRRGLDEQMKVAQIRAMETGKPLSIMLVDIDHFKRFNDTYGHQIGDQVLRLVSGVFKEQLREDDFPARYGGEEMIGVLENTKLETARAIAERVRNKISERKMTKRSTGEELGKLSVSIGVAEFQPGESVGDLIERADRALYQAKRTGRNRTVAETELEDDIAA